MKIAIIDYGSGNLRSAEKAFERAAAEAGIKADIQVTAQADDIAAADRIVLPGVGAFGDCRRGLDQLDGVHDVLDEQVLQGQKPFLGICVGMQLLADMGLEHGEHAGLGWIRGRVAAIELPQNHQELKIPHMGWNELRLDRAGVAHPVLAGLDHGDHAYFVHSFHFQVQQQEDVLAHVNYGQALTAVVGRDNIIGTQFHPEKSQRVGLRLITNFLQWQP